jgi:cytochrome c peroxidase
MSLGCGPEGAPTSSTGGTGGTGGQDTGGGGTGGAAGASYTDPYPAVVYPEENPFSPAKAVLGKILFWDEQLSGDASVACGTCHRPDAGGSDPRSGSPESVHPGQDGAFGTEDDVHGSLGVARCDVFGNPKNDPIFGLAPQVTPRKAPSTFDAMFAPKLFWDGRAGTQLVDPVDQVIVIPFGAALEVQSIAPFLNNVEMACEGQTWFDLEAKIALVPPLAVSDPPSYPPDIQAALAASPTYADLFAAAFPSDPKISTRNLLLAIATYERELASNQAPWDAFIAGDASALTAAQQHGLELFLGKGKCAGCHPPPLFTDNDFHAIGVTDPSFDPGREDVTHKPGDKGKMKTPSLRNVGLREAGGLLHGGAAPGDALALIMHSLNMGGTFPENLDPEIEPLGLTDAELADIIDFLRDGLTDPRVKDAQPPFDRPQLRTEE